jgi:hypothetical protein
VMLYPHGQHYEMFAFEYLISGVNAVSTCWWWWDLTDNRNQKLHNVKSRSTLWLSGSIWPIENHNVLHIDFWVSYSSTFGYPNVKPGYLRHVAKILPLEGGWSGQIDSSSATCLIGLSWSRTWSSLEGMIKLRGHDRALTARSVKARLVCPVEQTVTWMLIHDSPHTIYSIECHRARSRKSY